MIVICGGGDDLLTEISGQQNKTKLLLKTVLRIRRKYIFCDTNPGSNLESASCLDSDQNSLI